MHGLLLTGNNQDTFMTRLNAAPIKWPFVQCRTKALCRTKWNFQLVSLASPHHSSPILKSRVGLTSTARSGLSVDTQAITPSAQIIFS